MIGYVFIFFAAFFNACMDAFENENYYESIFKSWDDRFWYKRESWKYAKKILGYKFDAWHISKSLMIICFAAFAIWMRYYSSGSWWVIFINIACIWDLTFWFFYHKVFKIK